MQLRCPRCQNSMPLLIYNATGDYICACGKSIPYINRNYKSPNIDEFYEGRSGINNTTSARIMGEEHEKLR